MSDIEMKTFNDKCKERLLNGESIEYCFASGFDEKYQKKIKNEFKKGRLKRRNAILYENDCVKCNTTFVDKIEQDSPICDGCKIAQNESTRKRRKRRVSVISIDDIDRYNEIEPQHVLIISNFCLPFMYRWMRKYRPIHTSGFTNLRDECDWMLRKYLLQPHNECNIQYVLIPYLKRILDMNNRYIRRKVAYF